MYRIPDLYSSLAEESAEARERFCSYPWLLRQDGRRLRLHIVGLGDVGRTVAVGLRVLGGEVLDRIGIFDLNEAQAARVEMELNQISAPCGRSRMPSAEILREENLFACDVFLYCATKAVPAVDGRPQDVRMAQYGANRRIVAAYAEQAAEESFPGLFGVVSDPVDLLCMAAFLASQVGGYSLHPEQIQGFGLGVMYARAAYYAGKAADRGEKNACWFPEEGRVFGPHGQDLVAANSICPGHYDDALSRSLTEQTVHANLEMRAIGFKPYIAPAFSSAAFSVLAAVSGEWCDSARYLNGLYFGARNRTTTEGTKWESRELPESLFERVDQAYHSVEAVLCS